MLTLSSLRLTHQVMGDLTEFERAVGLVVSTVDFDRDVTVNVFETTIRAVRTTPRTCWHTSFLRAHSRRCALYRADLPVSFTQLGGLVSAHLLAERYLFGDNCTQLHLASSPLFPSGGDCSGYKRTRHTAGALARLLRRKKLSAWDCGTNAHLALTSNGPDGEKPLLSLAVDLADRLLPAFKTNTGIPYARVNLRFVPRLSAARAASSDRAATKR